MRTRTARTLAHNPARTCTVPARHGRHKLLAIPLVGAGARAAGGSRDAAGRSNLKAHG